MPLTSIALPILLGIVACGLLALLVIGKPHFARRGQRMASRAAIAVLLNLTVLGAVGALLNNEYAFYSSWGDLLGAPPEATPQEYGAPASEANAVASATASAQPHAASPQALPALAEPGKRLQKYEIDPPAGGKHKEKRKVYVYLPKDYDAAKATTYPVILALHGLPGGPDSYGKLGDFYAKVDAAVAAGRLRAPIVVIPQLNPSAHADTECVNAPNGAQTETWLADTLPEWVRGHFRAAPSRQSWATWGYSFGGWCATMLTMKHPTTFGAAVTYQGYFRPVFDDKPPFAPGSELARSYDLVALERTTPPPVALWLFASQADRQSYPSTREFLDAVRAPTSVTSRIGKGGGHRLSVWTRKIPASFDWLGQVQPGFAPTR